MIAHRQVAGRPAALGSSSSLLLLAIGVTGYSGPDEFRALADKRKA
jgi:hypothetical protein